MNEEGRGLLFISCLKISKHCPQACTPNNNSITETYRLKTKDNLNKYGLWPKSKLVMNLPYRPALAAADFL